MRAEERELPMEKATAVNTCLGVLMGRDCIYLDQVKQDALNNLTFTLFLILLLVSIYSVVL